MIEFKLAPGEVLVFNNQRLMHGRTAFDPSSGKRHIRSCSVDLDEFYSRLRILYALHDDPRQWMIFRKDQVDSRSPKSKPNYSSLLPSSALSPR